MILNFRHKGLERFFGKSDYRGIPAQHAGRLERLERLLDRLDASLKPDDMSRRAIAFTRSRVTEKGLMPYPCLVTGG